jgi:hypothetical protein
MGVRFQLIAADSGRCSPHIAGVTKGVAVTSMGTGLPRTMAFTFACRSLQIRCPHSPWPRAVHVGPSRPLVTSPMRWPADVFCSFGVVAHGHALQRHQAHALASPVPRQPVGPARGPRRESRPRARRRCAAPSGWPSSARPPPGWWWCRCRCRTGTGRPPAAANCAPPGPIGLDLGLGQQGAGKGLGMRGRDGDFKAVFTGVAAARDEQVGAFQM